MSIQRIGGGANQPLDTDLTAIAALVSAADKLPYATGAGTWSLTDFSAFARTILDDANAAAVRATIGAGISSVSLPIAESDVTNLTTDLADKQPLDSELTALAGLTSAADKLPYFTGSGTAALADLSSFIRTLLDDANAATARATLGAGTSSVTLPIAESDVTNLTTDLAAKAPLVSPTFTGTVTLPVGLTGVVRTDTGVVSVDTDVTDIVSAASDTAAGKVELATTAETTTGTDATRAVTPDGLHDMTSLAGAAWFLDEDAMASNSDTKVPSQQSTKAYVDAAIIAAGSYSDEQAQDAVGTILADTTSVNFTYTDATPEIKADVLFGSGAGVAAEGNHTHSYQPLDTDLTTIAGLSATTDNVIQSVASAWASRTPAQLKSSMSFVKGDVGLGNVDNTSDASKPVSTATQTALDLKQPLDAELTALAGLTSASDKLPYFSGAGAASVTDFSAFARTILDDADAATVRATIGAGTGGGDVSSDTATSVDAELALFKSTTGKLIKRATLTGLVKATSGVASAATEGTDYWKPGGTDVAVADGGTGASDAATARTNLGLVIGTNVQAFNARLSDVAALVDPNADQIVFWDDSAGALVYLALAGNLAISGTTLTSPEAHPDWQTGRFYGTASHYAGSYSTGVITANVLTASLLYVPKAKSVDRIQIRIITGVSASNIRLGIYNDSSGLPGSLVVDSGNIASATNGVDVTATINQALSPGRYWLAIVGSHGPSVNRFVPSVNPNGATGPNDVTFSVAVQKALTFGAMPDPFGSPTVTTGFFPHIVVRVA